VPVGQLHRPFSVLHRQEELAKLCVLELELGPGVGSLIVGEPCRLELGLGL
jgi:hypothetical protein